MSDKAKIFISSSGQSELKKLREATFDHLARLGHDPHMYEKNFGPWSAFHTIVEHCLEKVRESDIFFLYISDKSGTYLANEDATVTHLEMLEAHRHRKEMILFVDDSIHSLFFGTVKSKIDEAVKQHQEEHQQDLYSIYQVVKTLDTLPANVDLYTWVLLYDITQKGIYCETLSLGVDIQERLSQYLSSLLRRGALLLPAIRQIEKNELLAVEYDAFQDLVLETVGLMCKTEIQDWRRFLNTLREKMRGGTITKRFGQYRREDLGYCKDCSGITLFRREGEQMVLVERDGRTGSRAFFMLDDHESFVVNAYLRTKEDEETLFYVQEKQLLYLTSRVGEYVLSLHFLLDSSWNVNKVERFQEELLHGIMDQQGNKKYVGFAKLVLGGI